MQFDCSAAKLTMKETALNRLQLEACFVLFDLVVVKNARPGATVGTAPRHVAVDWHDVPP